MEKNQDYIEIDLFRLIRAIWKKAWVVILVSLVCAGAALSYAVYMIAPTYSASALMYVNNSSFSLGSTSFSISPSELSAAQNLVDTYIVIIKTRSTLNEVIEKADLPYTYETLSPKISASAVNGTEIFRITATTGDPGEAALIANTVAEILPERISKIVNGSSVRVVDKAVTPVQRSSPSYTRYTAIGFVIGLLLSCGIIVLLDLLDDQIHEADYLSGNGDIPVLAEIPNFFTSSKTYEYHSSGYAKGENGGKKNEEN